MTSNTEYMVASHLAAQNDNQAASMMGKRAFGLKTVNSMIGQVRSEGKSLKIGELEGSGLLKRSGLQLAAKDRVKDKENSIPSSKLAKLTVEAKIVHSIGQHSRPPIPKTIAPSSNENHLKTTFTLGQFNSVNLGRGLKISDRPDRRRSIFAIRASRPTDCSVSLPGLTIRVKIAN